MEGIEFHAMTTYRLPKDKVQQYLREGRCFECHCVESHKPNCNRQHVRMAKRQPRLHAMNATEESNGSEQKDAKTCLIDME